MDVHLVTTRLVLRRFTEDDVDLLVDLDGDPEVMRFISGGLPTSREEIRDEVLPSWLGWYDRSDHLGFWAAEDMDGAFLGWFHLRPGEGHGEDEPELGYRLRRSFWKAGLATEGSLALIESAFIELRARRVLAQTMVVNAASRRVMEKCGMRLVRRFHGDWPHPIPGDELGDVAYAIDREGWLAARSNRG